MDFSFKNGLQPERSASANNAHDPDRVTGAAPGACCLTAAYFPGSTETESGSQQKTDDVLQQNKLAVELETIAKKVRIERKGVPPTPFQNTLCDILESLDEARQTGETGPLLVVLTNSIGAASGYRQESSLSLTEYLDLMLISHVGSKN